jgi:hypothetical protein
MRQTIGVESWCAVWIPTARFAEPTPRVAIQTPTLPEAFAYPSAIKAAPPSWRVEISWIFS